ncbi:lipocalin family protein [Candidatus Latescibacterota bacterium]
MITQKVILLIVILVSIVVLSSCYTSKKMSTASIPAVKDFQLERYLGIWYEIARLPNSFEKDLDNVTANYSLRENGEINILNKGFNSEKKLWKDATGRAWMKDPNNPAHLRVSFFWKFSSDYKIIALDSENYSYALVTSTSKKYLWVLSRTPKMDTGIYASLVKIAKDYEFEVEKLYKVDQSSNM